MRRELIVGVFFFVALVVLAWLTMVIDDEGTVFGQPAKVYHARFTNVGGLKQNDPVFLSGLRVGKIVTIELYRKVDVQELDVAFTVERGFRVNAGCEAIIRTNALLGNKNLEITLGSPDAEELPPGSILKSSVTPGIDDILASINRIAASEDLRAIISNLRRVTGNMAEGRGIAGLFLSDESARDRVASMVEDLQGVVSDVRKGKGTVGMFLADEELASTVRRAFNDIQASVASLREISSRIEKGEGLIARLVNDETLAQDVAQTVADARDTVGSVKEIALKVNSGEGTLGKLVNDEALYANLSSAVANVNELTAKITSGDGTLARLINDREIFDELVRFVTGASEAVEDAREAAPITAFTSVLFSAVQ